MREKRRLHLSPAGKLFLSYVDQHPQHFGGGARGDRGGCASRACCASARWKAPPRAACRRCSRAITRNIRGPRRARDRDCGRDARRAADREVDAIFIADCMPRPQVEIHAGVRRGTRADRAALAESRSGIRGDVRDETIIAFPQRLRVPPPAAGVARDRRRRRARNARAEPRITRSSRASPRARASRSRRARCSTWCAAARCRDLRAPGAQPPRDHVARVAQGRDSWALKALQAEVADLIAPAKAKRPARRTSSTISRARANSSQLRNSRVPDTQCSFSNPERNSSGFFIFSLRRM